MSLLLTDVALEDRLLGREPYVPGEKALLSKVGGRCETDGTELVFDPMSPHEHRCPSCGQVHTGEYHDRWWLYPYHLWLAEQAVHAAVLGNLRDDSRHLELARDILTGYAGKYLEYPNRDNVLGPSRLFFSTYLESLWLLHVCVATDALENAGDRTTADDIRDRIVVPAVELIEEYDEGLSNRQVWNCAAIIAARRLLGERVDSPALNRAFAGTETQLMHAVGDDGSWYEGDNYHQFAHRGLWYAVALGERAGYEFDRDSIDRFEAGFAAPFRSALPDFTYPARKDSRYGARPLDRRGRAASTSGSAQSCRSWVAVAALRKGAASTCGGGGSGFIDCPVPGTHHPSSRAWRCVRGARLGGERRRARTSRPIEPSLFTWRRSVARRSWHRFVRG